MTSTRVRVVVVDDSSIVRDGLKGLLEEDDTIEVVGEAGNGHEAVEVITRLRPAVATIDIRMPGMDGLELIERLMATQPLPILVVTDQPVAGASGDLVYQAVRRGALDLARKPRLGDGPASAELRTLVRRLASVPVVRHVAGSRRSPSAPLVVPAGRPGRSRIQLVGIGASAGGPSTVAAILESLPAELPACIAVVQHLPSGFAASFTRFLQDSTKLRVELVSGTARVSPGTVLVAPDDRHLVAISREKFSAADTPPAEGHRPSVTTLFASLAVHYGPAAAGIVLSGIGRDGTDGLKLMRAAGGRTVAQDQATSNVYGMPKAAWEEGAAETILGLHEIAPAIVEIVTGGRG